MDLALWALNHNVPPAELASVLKITEEQVQYIYQDIRTKRRTTRYLHNPPVLMSEIPELDLDA
jgi:NAD+ synthase